MSKNPLMLENFLASILALSVVFIPAGIIALVVRAALPVPELLGGTIVFVVAIALSLRYHAKIRNKLRSVSYSAREVRNASPAEMVRLLWKDPMARLAMVYMALFLSLGILSFIWTPYDYRAQDLYAARQGPSWAHWFGTDLIGRDMFTRVLYAARITDTLIILTIFIGGLPLSILLGVTAGYLGGKVDWAIMRFGELFVAVPSLLFILLLTATVRPLYDDFLFNLGPVGEWSIRTGVSDLVIIFFVTSFIFWVSGARFYRSMVISLRHAPFVEGGRMMGAGNKRIIGKYILPQLYPFIAHAGLLMLAGVIGTEIALSFFGIGIRPPNPSFGQMFSESASVQILNSSMHLLLIPGAIVGLFLYSILFLELRLTVILASVYEREER